MSEAIPDVLREPISWNARPHRGFEERLALRYPRLLAFLSRVIWRMPRRSRLRRAVLRGALERGWEGMNRADLDVGLALYHEDVESAFEPGFASLGFADTRGRDERRRMLMQVYDETRELRFEPEELIYVGEDRLLVIGRMKGGGSASGAPFDSEWANLMTISDGFVVRDQVIRSHREALEAVGLSESDGASA